MVTLNPPPEIPECEYIDHSVGKPVTASQVISGKNWASAIGALAGGYTLPYPETLRVDQVVSKEELPIRSQERAETIR